MFLPYDTPMGPGRSSSLRTGGDSSTVPDSGRTGGESDRLDVVALRDAPGEPPLPLGKGKGRIDEIKYPAGLEYLTLAVQNSLTVGPSRVSLYMGKFSRDDIGPILGRAHCTKETLPDFRE